MYKKSVISDKWHMTGVMITYTPCITYLLQVTSVMITNTLYNRSVTSAACKGGTLMPPGCKRYRLLLLWLAICVLGLSYCYTDEFRYCCTALHLTAVLLSCCIAVLLQYCTTVLLYWCIVAVLQCSSAALMYIALLDSCTDVLLQGPAVCLALCWLIRD